MSRRAGQRRLTRKTDPLHNEAKESREKATKVRGRMLRRLLDFAAVGLLVLCAAMVAILAIGLGRVINKSTLVTPHVKVGVVSENGALSFWLVNDAIGGNWEITYTADASYAGGAALSFGWFHLDGNRWRTGQLRVISAPGWVWVLIAAIPPALWFAVVRRRWPAFKPYQCQDCGYNLTGNTSGVCPECGTPFQPDAAAE